MMDQSQVELYFSQLMSEGLGLDLTDPNLEDTPKRVAKMYCREFFLNIGEKFTDFKSFPNKDGYDQMIVFDNIHFISTCSHHFLPFTGLAWLVYIPKESFVGMSKPARLIEHYASRPQLQETLCYEVIEAFKEGIKPQGCMVVMRGIHSCMACRGVKQTNGAGMISSAIDGVFLKDSVKQEALKLIELSIKL